MKPDSGVREKGLLEAVDVSLEFGGKTVLNGFSLTLDKGQVHVVTGSEGSGKSALAFAIMGHPRYEITRGRILFEGSDLASVPPFERARRGIFLGFQNPHSLPGVSVASFLRSALKAVRGASVRIMDFRKDLSEKLKLLEFSPNFAERDLGTGLTEAEKRRLEILQMLCLSPKLAILDGGASGFDEVCLRVISQAVGRKNTFLILAREPVQLGTLKPRCIHL